MRVGLSGLIALDGIELPTSELLLSVGVMREGRIGFRNRRGRGDFAECHLACG